MNRKCTALDTCALFLHCQRNLLKSFLLISNLFATRCILHENGLDRQAFVSFHTKHDLDMKIKNVDRR
jgi:hypothetical protein